MMICPPVLQMLRLRGGGEATEKESEEAMKYDRVLWDMLQAHPDEIHFLNTIFNFLQVLPRPRKTVLWSRAKCVMGSYS
jgi:hypothetical protein